MFDRRSNTRHAPEYPSSSLSSSPFLPSTHHRALLRHSPFRNETPPPTLSATPPFSTFADASNDYDEEVNNPDEMDFSDDEEERRAKRRNRPRDSAGGEPTQGRGRGGSFGRGRGRGRGRDALGRGGRGRERDYGSNNRQYSQTLPPSRMPQQQRQQYQPQWGQPVQSLQQNDPRYASYGQSNPPQHQLPPQAYYPMNPAPTAPYNAAAPHYQHPQFPQP